MKVRVEVKQCKGNLRRLSSNHLIGWASQQHGYVGKHALHHCEGLRHTEAPKGGVGGQVSPASGTATPQVGDVVDVVHGYQHLLHHLWQRKKRVKNIALLRQGIGGSGRSVTNHQGVVQCVSSQGVVLKVCSQDATVVHEPHLAKILKHYQHQQQHQQYQQLIYDFCIGKSLIYWPQLQE